MKNNRYLLIILVACSIPTVRSFNIPKFYHGRIFLDEPRFEEENLFTADITFAGASKHFRKSGYKGHFECAELIFQLYQNFKKGFFVHAYLPFCWVRLTDLESIGQQKQPHDQCIKKTDIYSPTLCAGWTLNYEKTKHLDYLDLTFEIGALLNTPAHAINIPLFPIGYTTQPGFAGAAYFAMGAYEWLTLGLYTQVISFQPATIWSAGSYIKFDHLIPKISVTLACCGDGQNKNINSIEPWQMFSIYLAGEVDLASDQRPWLPRFKAFYTKPVKGYTILKAGMGGFTIGIDTQITF